MSTPEAKDPQAEHVFEEWLVRVEDGEGVPFEVVLEGHPDLERPLRRLHRDWRNLCTLEANLFEAGSDDAPPPGERRRGSGIFRGPESVGDGAEALVAGALVGPYELEAEAGRGAMGVVWRARDRVLGTPVALKFLPHVLSTDRLAMLRLRREAQVLLRLAHPNVVRLRTIETHRGVTFLVEEYLGGPNLNELVERRLRQGERGLAAADVRWIVESVAPALDYAHGEGVTHRDLKPSNLMLDRAVSGPLGQGEERLKLTDFGLAFVASSALSQISTYRPSGTLPYMAPEVLLGRKPTPAADVYSLGATLYDLVAGEPPFAHGDISTQVLHRRPDPLRSGDAALDACVAAALEKNPADRPASGADLLALLRGEPGWGGSGRAAGPRRLRPVLAALAVVFVLALAAAAWWKRSGDAPATAAREDASPPPAAPAVALPTPEPHADRPGATVLLRGPYAEERASYLVGLDPGGLVLEGTVDGGTTGELMVLVDSKRLPTRVAADGTFRVVDALLPGQVHRIRIEEGGVELRRFDVELDAQPPVLELLAPATSPFETELLTVDLRVRMRDVHPGTVLLDGRPLAREDESTWSAASLPLRPGRNAWNVLARDAAGNETPRRVEVIHRASTALAAMEPAPNTVLPWGEARPVVLRFHYAVQAAWLDDTSLQLGDDGRTARGVLSPPPTPGPFAVRWRVRLPSGDEDAGELPLASRIHPRPVVVAGTEFEVLDPTPRGNRWPARIRDPRTDLVFRLVDPGAFFLGSREGEGCLDEEPRREVRLTRPFYLAETEVSIAQWRRGRMPEDAAPSSVDRLFHVPGSLPAPSDAHPITGLGWNEARAWCGALAYRLPTEAEWEYACRAGGETLYPFGDTPAEGEGQANVADAAAGRLAGRTALFPFDDGFAGTAPTGSFAPNAWGFHDMAGNVWEWCADAYDPAPYPVAAEEFLEEPLPVLSDPVAESSDGSRPRVLRGGSWASGPADATTARRACGFADVGSDVRGLRPAFTPEAAAPSRPTPLVVAEPASLELRYDDGTVRVQCALRRDDEGNPRLHGHYVRLHPNGEKAETGTLEFGRREDRWTAAHPDGARRSTGQYRADRRHRSWVFTFPDGTRAAAGSYDSGVRVGPWTFLDEDGDPDAARSGEYGWTEEGDGRGPTLDGSRHGRWTFRWPNGAPRWEGAYVRGVRHGPWRFRHPDGTLDPCMLSGTWEDGERIEPAPLPWYPSTEEYTPPPRIRLSSPALLSLAPTTAAAAVAGGIAALRQADAGALDALTDRLAADRRAALAGVVSELLRLDLGDAADLAHGDRLMLLAGKVLGGEPIPWRATAAPADRASNRLRILRLLSLWHLGQDQRALWEIELAAPRAPRYTSPPAVTPGTEGWFPWSLPAEDLLLDPPLADISGRTPGRWIPRLGHEEAMRWAKRGGVDEALADGLAWLARHQSPDGGWDADGFHQRCGTTGLEVCDGKGRSIHDVGVTGLALLAFQGAGHSALEGPYRDTVRRGLVWLAAQQDPDTGVIGSLRATAEDAVADPPRARGVPPQPPGSRACSQCAGMGLLRTPKGILECDVCKGRGRLGGGSRVPLLLPTAPTAQGVEGTGSPNVFDHAIATQALAEAFGQTPTPLFGEAARAAARWIQRVRNPYGVWRYNSPPIGDNDTAITGWMVAALAACRSAGIDVRDNAFEGASAWFGEVTDPATGRCGYDTFGSPSSRYPANQHYPREKGEAMTATALLCRHLLGQSPREIAVMGKQADLLVRTLPAWDAEGFGCDMYYWYFATHALRMTGGKHWKAWETALRHCIVDNQRRDGDTRGSWDPVGPWGTYGGRVYSTALMLLSAEGAFRYNVPGSSR